MLRPIRMGHWWMVAVLLFLSVLSYLDRFLLTILVDPIKQDLGLTDFQMGLLLGPAFAIAFAMFGLPFGWAADRFSRRWVVFCGAVAWSIATALCGLAGNFMSLFAARMGVGVGEASLTPAAYSLIADKAPPDRLATSLAVFSAGPKWGQAAAYAFSTLIISFAAWLAVDGPALFRGLAPWQLSFLIVGIPGAFAAFAALTFSEPARPERAAEPTRANAGPELLAFVRMHLRLLMLLLVGFTLVTMTVSGTYAWMATYMGRAFGWGVAQFGPALALMMLFVAATYVVHGFVADLLTTRWRVQDAHLRYYTWLLTASAPLIAILYFIKEPMLFLLLMAVVQFMAFPYMLFVTATISRVVPGHLRGQVTAWFCLVNAGVASALSPMIVGALTDFVFKDDAKLGWSLAVVGVAGAVSGLIVLRLALRPFRQALDIPEAPRGTGALRPADLGRTLT